MVALRSRPAGEGFKPPTAALAEDRCGERVGKGAVRGIRRAAGGNDAADEVIAYASVHEPRALTTYLRALWCLFR